MTGLMALKPCLVCGALSPASRCPTHTTTRSHWSPNRDRSAQRRFRRELMVRSGGRCEVCGSTHDLRAAHTVPLANGGGYHPTEGRMLCRRCDKASDPHAR